MGESRSSFDSSEPFFFGGELRDFEDEAAFCYFHFVLLHSFILILICSHGPKLPKLQWPC